ncbi:unnamed protein product [Brachionus calyciflorus]|uniref:Uncharacterized protein n=1 Tax=Brachionus calyciflorus TaxID=104777 RepID=A0A814JKK4_9BILA|nr:unnamed protein product [Brachionus calyciflorus]
MYKNLFESKYKFLDVIEKDGFFGLTNLRTLILVNNHIQELNKDMFNGLEKLVTLDLRDNYLKKNRKIHFLGCFNGLVNLKRINLANQFDVNRITIENDVFDSCPNIECLNLSLQKFDHLDGLRLNYADNLKVLGLYGENVIEIKNFIKQFKNLECLCIQINKSDENLDNICLSNLNMISLRCFKFFPKLGKNLKNLKILDIEISSEIFDSSFFDECENLNYLSILFLYIESLEKLNETHLKKLKNLKCLKLQVFEYKAKIFDHIISVFDTKQVFCKQLFDGKNFEHKFVEVDHFKYYILYHEFKVCDSSEVYLERILEKSSANIDVLMNRFEIDFIE